MQQIADARINRGKAVDEIKRMTEKNGRNGLTKTHEIKQNPTPAKADGMGGRKKIIIAAIGATKTYTYFEKFTSKIQLLYS